MKKTNRLNISQTRLRQVFTLFLVLFFTRITIAQKGDVVTAARKMNLHGEVWKILEREYEVKWENNQPQKGALKFIRTFEFDSEGNLTEETYINAVNQKFQKIAYQYGKPGLLKEITFYNSDNQVTGRQVKEYDSKDFIVSWTRYDSSNKIRSEEKYTYQFISNTQYIVTTQTGNNRYVSTRTLNNDSKVISIIYSAGMTHSETYAYNDKGQQISFLQKDSKGNFAKEFLYDYDAAGNVIQEKYKNEVGYSSTDTYTYIYDEKNNWTSRIKKGTSITEREVSYFASRPTRQRRN